MKATKILEWAIRESINFEFVGKVSVPDTGDEDFPQDAEWWERMFGGCPHTPATPGEYIYYWWNLDPITIDGKVCEPDTEIEMPDGVFYLYRIED